MTHRPHELNAGALCEIIAREVRDDFERTNAHGLTLADCLVRPTVVDVNVEDDDGPVSERMWLIGEPRDFAQSAYSLVYDPVAREFGLATSDPVQGLMLVGLYGSVLDAFDAM